MDHAYVSTACQHAADPALTDDEATELHACCRVTCKFCDAVCACLVCDHRKAGS